jgi:carbon monoxide dehydrogenase subunit G
MLIEFKENVSIAASSQRVLEFVLDPQSVVGCMPGATLKEVHGGESFDGALTVKFGGMSVQFSGNIRYDKIDRNNRLIEMVVTAKQYGGGSLKGNVNTALTEISPHETGIEVISVADLKGGLVKAGKSMIEAMASEIIKEYIANVRIALESPQSNGGDGMVARAPSSSAASLNILSVFFSLVRRRIRTLLSRRR